MAYILLDKNNLFHNLKLIVKQAGSIEKVAIVLKDNAYGHGLKEMATLLQEFGIKKSVVRNLKEALEIEDNFDEILILAEDDFSTYSHTFHIALNSMEKISSLPQNAKVHIKLDSGMHRNGISPNELEACIYGLLEKGHQITGVFTHHRSADTLSSEFFWQNENFKLVKSKVVNICEQLSIPIPSFHSCNSSALFRTKNFDEDLARVGIATYGYLESDNCFDNPDLKPVLSLWAKRLSSREIKKGEKVGYGGGFKTLKDLIISTYDLGYGDGFLRLHEKQKYKTPKGYEILGRVSMDNISINSKEDTLCIFEDAKKLAKLQDTISYEIITSLSRDIKREIK